MSSNGIHRMTKRNNLTNPDAGEVKWAPLKSGWFTLHCVVAVVGGVMTFSPGMVLLSFILTVITLCLGHSIGLHRLIIHRSFECPKALEYVLVHLGTLVGMGGPFKMLYLHDIRDWSQRHLTCHPFFTHQTPLWKDFYWQNHCHIHLEEPPKFTVESALWNDRIHRFMDRYWMLQQLPWVILCYGIAGWAGIVWGISVRITVSLIGHWFVGYVAHNQGHRDWRLKGHAIQGYNSRWLGMLSMGEGWHNNHHAFPESARLGLKLSQPDPGWWALTAMRKLGLVWNLKLPKDLGERIELEKI